MAFVSFNLRGTFGFLATSNTLRKSLCHLNLRGEGFSTMKAVCLLSSFLDQHGFEYKMEYDNAVGSTTLSLKEHDDIIEIRPDLTVSVYCDIVAWVKDEAQLIVSLYDPRSLQSIAKYLRSIPKKKKNL